MDWDKQYSTSFERDLGLFEWKPRFVKCYQITVGAPGSPSDFDEENIATDERMTSWLESRAYKPSGPGWPKWDLTILAAMRGDSTPFEIEAGVSANNLLNIGLSKGNFLRITEDFSLPKSLLHRVSSDQSHYDRQHVEIDGSEYSFASFILRTSPLMLNDLALSLRSDSDKAATFVLLHGFTDSDFKTFSSWLKLMKDDAGHPLLIVALFMEMNHRQLQTTYRSLRNKYLEQNAEAFSAEAVAELQHVDAINARVQLVMSLYDSLVSHEAELVAFGMRVASLINSIKHITRHVRQEQQAYMHEVGGRLEDRLRHLSQDNEYLRAKSSTTKESTSALISAMWNIVTLSESQVSKQISIASKRDSSIMMGITVGTLTFLPGTAIATIFALPMFNWNAGPREPIVDRHFWIYLAVSIPITGVTLMTLFLWMFVIDIREQSPNMTTKDSVRKLLKNIIRPVPKMPPS